MRSRWVLHDLDGSPLAMSAEASAMERLRLGTAIWLLGVMETGE